MKFFIVIALFVCLAISQRTGSGTGSQYTGSGTGSYQNSSSTGSAPLGINVDPRLNCLFNCGKQVNWNNVNIFVNLFRPQTLQDQLVRIINNHGPCFAQCLATSASGSTITQGSSVNQGSASNQGSAING